MTDHIVLLRGINVGGHRPIKMADLRTLLSKYGYENVTTYIQSGNIVLSSDDPAAKIQEDIAKLILDKYGYDVPTVALTAEEWKEMMAMCAYNDVEELKFLTVTILHHNDKKIDWDTLIEKYKENSDAQGKERYLFQYCAQGTRNTPLTNQRIETYAGIPGTTRNWKTVIKMMDMIEKR